ncbi:sigma-70 family RNA polymerase sigma factor [Stenotrophomonas nitritireducens]|nr:sigma-70 family RNA polymerase sigma factor [Stenotrophomonas nitritireducens]
MKKVYRKLWIPFRRGSLSSSESSRSGWPAPPAPYLLNEHEVATMAVRVIARAGIGSLRHEGTEAVIEAPLHARRTHWLAGHVLPHESALRRRLRSQVPTGLEVDDVVQEAYALIAAQERVEQILERRAYLFTVARSVVFKHFRRSCFISIDTNSGVSREHHELTLERHAGASQELRRLAWMIDGLPPRCGQAFVMCRVEQLPQYEVARRMGISRSSVEKHLARASSLLMETMAQANRPPACAATARADEFPQSVRMFPPVPRKCPVPLRGARAGRSPRSAARASAFGKGMAPFLEECGDAMHVMQHSPSFPRHAG